MALRTTLTALLVLGACVPAASVEGADHRRPLHTCVHDALRKKVPKRQLLSRGPQAYVSGAAADERRLQSAGSTWAPLRIVPMYTNLSQLSGTTANFLVNTLMPEAARRWQNALSVNPVVGPLYAFRDCASYWQTPAPWQCRSLVASTGCDMGDGTGPIVFNATMLGAQTFYPSVNQPQTTTAGVGLANADFGVLVTAIQSSICGTPSTGGVAAYATTCQRDQFDRPTWGRINFCPQMISLAPTELENQAAVAMHELGHAIGFTSDSWYLFRNNDTTRSPKTPRNPNIPSLPSSTYRTTDRCGSTAYFPSQNTVAYFSERGMSCSYPSTINVGDCVHKFVTPAAAFAARWYFNCSTLNGAELEDQFPNGMCDLQSSHWDQRILASELMAPVIVDRPKVSPMTLGVFEDSGWYRANFSATGAYLAGQDWGFGQGCAFATAKCLTSSSSSTGIGQGQPPHYFYNSRGTSSSTACTVDRRGIAFVSVSSYSANLPPYFQYYSSGNVGGGASPYYDYCPIAEAYSNRLCADPGVTIFSSDRFYGMTFGAASKCFDSTLRWPTVTPNTPPGSGCYSSVCNSSSVLTIFVGAPSAGGPVTQVMCTPSNAWTGVSVTGYSGTITCPDPASLCGQPMRYGGTPFNASTSFPPDVPSPNPSPSAASTTCLSEATAILVLALLLRMMLAA